MGPRGIKWHGFNPNRGFKQMTGIAARGFKHVGTALKNMPKTVANSDSFTRKAANTLQSLGEYGQLAGAAFGNEALGIGGKKLHDMGSSIHEYRRSNFANRLRNDFNNGNASIMN